MNRARILTGMFAALVLPAIAWAAAPNVVESSFDSAGVKIAYITAGQGDPVVLVHGLYSSAAMNWQMPGTFAMLAEHHQVIAFDLRGHGKSDVPEGEAAYGQPMVEDIVRLMDHLHVQKAQLVGYSLGGIIVMKFAVDHPDRVSSVALGGMGWLREGSPLQNIWEKLPGSETSKTPPACLHGVAKLAVTEEQVKSLKMPLEMLVGDRDPCRRLYVQPLAAMRNDFPVVVIEGAGHIACVGKEQFKQELLKWIDNNASH